ncbi:DUF2020 domain-containing protein [Actinokineospora pegani]|uniref:DUF2020 domain-containing protein n=1 Tax=Actinokineospora pegani TaxID=2654637 RepID=UPI0012EAE658|nr:DUF2020 domain-containing protein [Actinokineospora pegani]
MKRAVILAAPLLALAACTADPGAPTVETPPSTTVTSAPGSSSTQAGAATPPPEPEPVADGPCPYLTSTAVAEANGQHVTKVRISADKPTPACFFYRPDGSVQLMVRVYQGDAATAKAVVDQAAPIDSSNPANQPAGWKGGSLSGEENAVYAVAKDGVAVVVDSNQKQTIKARRLAETTITKLGL